MPPVRYYTGYGLSNTIVKPPYSTLTAYDLNSGTIRWQVPAGDEPKAFAQGAKDTGVMSQRSGIITTSTGLLFHAGGDGKNADFTELRDAFRGKVRHVVLIGKDAARLEATLAGVVTTERAADLPAAVLAASRAARRGDTVLLSPACASLDMFRDYAQRGEVFAAAVRELAS